MLGYAALGLAVLALLLLAARWFAAMSAHDVAQAVRAFIAAFSALASTGLLLTGRLGLAVVTIGATVMAVRSILASRRGADPLHGQGGGPGSSVETALLSMRLDHATGEVDGRVRTGAFAGQELSRMALGDLLALLQTAQVEDPSSVPLLEAYLDRRTPDWRDHARARTENGGGGTAAPGAMDERTALEILGLQPGADEAEIKAAHRRLMARLHPDHGGSSYLASQLNRARDVLMQQRR